MPTKTKNSKKGRTSKQHVQSNGRTTKRTSSSRADTNGKKSKSVGRRSSATARAQSNGAAAKNTSRGRQPGKSNDTSHTQFLKKHSAHLSSSTRRAHWINKPGEHANRDGETLATRNHAVIQQWAKAHGGVPATVLTKKTTDRPRVLRIDFPGYSNGRLHQISWKEWLNTFDKRDLVFLFQETTKDGQQSNFSRLDSPHREDG